MNEAVEKLVKTAQRHALQTPLSRSSFGGALPAGLNQFVCFLGHSGSGKSKAVQQALHQVANSTLTSIGPIHKSTFMDRLDSAIELLDAFTCAQTFSNTNASRGLRRFTFSLDHRGHFSGLRVNIDLLEPCRVTRRPKEEPTFHIFYYFLAGLDDSQKKKLLISDLDTPNAFMTPLQRASPHPIRLSANMAEVKSVTQNN
ncbi:hypothetical protein Ciccas_000197 [Cichlidogyrus casuarinus]|uniref:Myosin motor domain-containing protein n=1 Tax=Cichlidogyrus casuarinus TaxID=1844966 RepID=A0ABD2QNL8_9PLAT